LFYRYFYHISDAKLFERSSTRPVFFNLFAAAEPHTSVKVTCGTPSNDPCIHKATYPRLKLQSVYGLISLAGQSPHEDDKTDKDGQL